MPRRRSTEAQKKQKNKKKRILISREFILRQTSISKLGRSRTQSVTRHDHIVKSSAARREGCIETARVSLGAARSTVAPVDNR